MTLSTIHAPVRVDLPDGIGVTLEISPIRCLLLADHLITLAGQAIARLKTENTVLDTTTAALMHGIKADLERKAREIPVPSKTDRMKTDWLKAHGGPTRTVDFGADQPAVEALRACGFQVCRDRNGKWLVDWNRLAPGFNEDIWAKAKMECAERGMPFGEKTVKKTTRAKKSAQKPANRRDDGSPEIGPDEEKAAA
ncbi:MAG: hypothetical protein FD149_1668 [Rhodospirillaceae bacterium]|nr:MAG: hypothetical protein FD149_1668 [Rhodospirillaceae bacterium]